uniref:Uncharacterized protein n=1 Tax=Octactis speculum TaxID=3111310 RepID=A0A7S2D998_9STRA|mmetsp:Transcript_45372/g.61912  ORF Transcript_45372/g.61912 Transcript_45372/m.61912 type:complete len:146 (+) Transcript_45372:322-759(+)
MEPEVKESADDDEEGKPGESEAPDIDKADEDDGTIISGEEEIPGIPFDLSLSGDGTSYSGSKCFHSQAAADQQIGGKFSHRFNDCVIYVGEVISALSKPVTTRDPAHFINVVKYEADGKTEEMWMSRLQRYQRYSSALLTGSTLQ